MTRMKDSLGGVDYNLRSVAVDLARIADSLEALVGLLERIALPITIPATLLKRGLKL